MTTAERSKLKSIAATQKAAINVGKNGITPNLISEVSTALYHNELVKVSLLRSCALTLDEVIQELSAKTASQLVLKVGAKFVLYKYSDKESIQHLL